MKKTASKRRADYIHKFVEEKKKPDPVKLGEELAEYCRKRRETCGIALKWDRDDAALLHLLELHWERDFWRSKCLGE